MNRNQYARMLGLSVVVADVLFVSAVMAGNVTGSPVPTFTTTNNSRDIPLTTGSPTFTANLSTWTTFSSQLHSVLGIGAAGNGSDADVEYQDNTSPDGIHGDIALPYAMVGRGANGQFGYFLWKFQLDAGSVTGPGGTIDTSVYFRHDPVGTHGQNAVIGINPTADIYSNLSGLSNLNDFTKLNMETVFGSGNPGFNTYTGNASLPIPAGLNSFYVAFTDEGSSARFALNSFTVNANVIGAPDPTWAVNSSGDWNVGSNWSTGNVPNAVGAKAFFAVAVSSPKTVYSDTGVTVGTLKFDNANGYQIAGQGSLSIDVATGAGSIAVLQGTHKINIPMFVKDNTTADIAAGAVLKISNPMMLVGGVTLTKAGAGTLSIEAPVANVAPATLASSAGVTNALMDLGSNTTLNVSGGTTNLNTTQHLAALNVSGGTAKVGPGTSVVVSTKALNISGSGKVDLQNSKLIVDYTGASVLASVKTAITSGSLTTSQSLSGRAIGYGEASDLFAGPTGTFAGETVDSTAIVAAYTVVGDASLDGTVNSTDFNLLAGHYGQTANSRWTQGDFDSNGKVNTIDFNVLAGSFGTSLPPSAPTLGSVVPEPASIAALALASTLLMRRRNHSHVFDCRG